MDFAKKKSFGNLHLEYGKRMGRDFIEVYSYDVLIASHWFANYFDDSYYSVTTRFHQGIAHAIISRFTATDSHSEFFELLERATSQSDIKRFFGYIPAKYYN